MNIIYSHSINIFSLWINNNICIAVYVLMCLVIGTISDLSGYILKYRVYIPYFLNLKKIWIFKHLWPHEFLKRKLLERYFFFGYRILGWIFFFSTLTNVITLFYACNVSNENSAVILFFVLLYEMHVFLWLLLRFSLHHWFSAIWLKVSWFGFISSALYLFSILSLWANSFHQTWKVFGYYSFKYFFLSSPHLQIFFIFLKYFFLSVLHFGEFLLQYIQVHCKSPSSVFSI